MHESPKAKASTGGAGSVLSIVLKSSTEEHMVKGAVLHGTAPRLLHVDGIDVEAPLERNLIYLRNRDVPGVIGKVGTILGEESNQHRGFLARTPCSAEDIIRTSRARRSLWSTSTGACRRKCCETARDSGGAAGEGCAAALGNRKPQGTKVHERFILLIFLRGTPSFFVVIAFCLRYRRQSPYDFDSPRWSFRLSASKAIECIRFCSVTMPISR